MREKRRYTRYDVSQIGTLHGSVNISFFKDTVLFQLSRGGCGFLSVHPLEDEGEGEVVAVKFQWPDHFQGEIEIQGRLLYDEKVQSKVGTRYLVGIQFINGQNNIIDLVLGPLEQMNKKAHTKLAAR